MATVKPDKSMLRDTPPRPVLSVRDLEVNFRVEGGLAKAVDGVSFDLLPGEVLGVVGESGSGKSVTALSIMRLIPDPPGNISRGQILFEDQDLLQNSYAQMRKIRGNQIAMIFQEPMTALNPVFTVGMQVVEMILTHENTTRGKAFDRAVQMLEQVGIPDARLRMKDYPHQFSGGMRQRVMIAMALACRPRILIADEPTTALDVTTQAQILDLMLDMKQREEGASIIFITHDLSVVAETCHRAIVMYGGMLQEVSSVKRIYDEPLHPYTQGLLASLPGAAKQKMDRLYTIPGNVPSIMDMPKGCKFCTRCDRVMDRCKDEVPRLHQVHPGHLVRCHLYDPDESPSGGASG